MKNLKLFYILIFFTIPSISFALDLEFCPKWPAVYTDNTSRYDYIQPTSMSTTLKVPNIPVKIVKHTYYPHFGRSINTTYKSKTGSNGCVKRLIPWEENSIYFITIQSQIYTSDGHSIAILGKSANSWGTKTKKTVNSYFAIKKVTAPTNGSFSKTIDINMPDSPANRLMPIIGEMAKRANSLGWEASESIHVYPYGKSNLCKHISSTATNYYNFSHNHVYRICLGNSSSYNKFILLHEAGHAISDMNNGPLTTDYSGDSKKGAGTGWIQDPYNFCKNDIAKYQEKSHSYYTREFLGAAACEGFADFFAVAVLNNRNPDNNNNYLATMNTVTSWPNPDSIKKRQYSFPFISNPFLPDWERIPGEAEKLPEGTNISIGINSTTPEFSNWTNKYCKPPVSFQHLTTESDWINFFWSIYAAPDAVRFSISEIATIWHEAKTSSSKAYCLPFNVDPQSSYKNPWTCKTVFFQAYPPGTPDYCYSPYGGYEESYECQLKPAAKRTIGKTWNDLQKYVEKKYGKNSPKATLFKQYGLKTGVTFY